ncbi:MAG TPA: flagellar basal body protein [Acetobacteraceae bacterium]|nr:flagellar basal body protein [Acetobacteraceae bacterium]
MDPTRIALFDLAERRLAWTERRQAVLAQNIANADTPGWRPRDVAPFAARVDQAGAGLARTDPRHLVGTSDTSGLAKPIRPTGHQPDGNAVSLDQELTKVADTDTTQSLVSAIYHTYLGLFRTAIGQGGASG